MEVTSDTASLLLGSIENTVDMSDSEDCESEDENNLEAEEIAIKNGTYSFLIKIY